MTLSEVFALLSRFSGKLRVLPCSLLSIKGSAPLKSEFNPKGQSLQEYAILFGLIGVVGIGSLVAMGGNVQDLFNNSSDVLAGRGTGGNDVNRLTAMLSTPANPNANQTATTTGDWGSINDGPQDTTGASGSVQYTLQVNSQTGQLEITAQGGQNTTSADGGTSAVKTKEQYAFSTIKIANTLDAIAQAELDPASKAYIANLSKMAYYMGMAEGEMDDISAIEESFDKQNLDYVNGTALRDLINYSGTLDAALKNPPAGLSGNAKSLIMALGQEVSGIGQQYQSNLTQFVDKNGNIITNWSNPENCSPKTGKCASNGEPGDSLVGEKDPGYNDIARLSDSSMGDVKFEGIKAAANKLIENGTITKEPVQVTLTDAKTLDEAATIPNSETQTAPSPEQDIQQQ